jgi:HAE1 family hydrophobic/amphiphilic exporter-1
MAIAVAGGLLTSTALTLVIVPAVFTLVDDLERWLGPRVSRAIMAASDEPGEPRDAEAAPHGAEDALTADGRLAPGGALPAALATAAKAKPRPAG